MILPLLAVLAMGVLGRSKRDSSPPMPPTQPAAGVSDAGLPAAGTTMVVQANTAVAKGKWSAVPNPLVSGSEYMSAGEAGVGTSLEFPIEVDKPTEIAVSPVWFTHGDQHRARRFPDPVPHFNVQQDWSVSKDVWEYCDKGGPLTYPAPFVARPGPDVIDVYKSKAFFSAPAGGKVGIADLKTEKVTGVIDIGGYVSDLVVNRDRGELLVADAARNRIVIFDAKDAKQLAEAAVPALPWSIALHGGKLYVACMTAKKVVVLDVAGRKLDAAVIDLPVGPQHVEIVGEQVVVRMLPMLLDAKTQEEIPADRLTYWPSSKYSNPLPGETAALKKAGEVFPKAEAKVFCPADKPTATILDAGPTHHRIRSDYTDKKVQAKVYLAQPGVKGVTVLPVIDESATTSQPTGEIATIELDDTPSSLFIFNLQLYAMCKETRKVHIIDVVSNKVVRTLSLPYKADEFFVGCLVPKITTVEQITGGPIQAGVMPGRIIMGLHPLAFAAGTLSPAAEPAATFFPYARRSEYQWSDDPRRQLRVENLHTIRVDRTRYIDTSSVTDYSLVANPARLMPGDLPGAVTLSVDGGPQCDWENDIWFSPDYRTLLARGTQEFDLWNAVRFQLKPGKHVLKVTAHSPYANLRALRIRQTLAGELDVKLRPLPENVHRAVPLPSYGGLFEAGEDVAFSLNVTNKSDHAMDLSARWSVANYLGKTVLEGTKQISTAPGATATAPLPLAVSDTGRHTIEIEFSSPEGSHKVFHRFVKLPRLDHPRMLFRAEEMEVIRGRIAQHPVLFQRYRDWLRANRDKPDFIPKTFKSTWGDMPAENPKWRGLAMQFADMLMEPPYKPRYEDKLLGLLDKPPTGVAWEGNYSFHDGHTILNDLMASTSQEAVENIQKNYGPGDRYVGKTIVGGCLPDYLLAVKEPLSPRDRAALYRFAMEMTNYDHYFGAHAGSRGGNWWHGTTAMCRCPIHSIVRSHLWYRGFFGEKDIFQRTSLRGVLTLQSYAYPRFDSRNFLERSAFRETNDPVNYTGAMRWALSALSRLPLEKTYYKETFDVLAKLEGPMKDEARETDELMAKGSNVVLPMYLAMGWIDPALKEVQWEEMPPSMIFDVEGAACMKSGWDRNMTDIYFVSGVRDTSYRAIPNHFHVFKAGEMVVGTQRTGDHGDPIAFYGNAVRVGESERFPGYLHRGWGYERQDERWVLDVHGALACTYMIRDWRLSGYRQDGARWEGGGHPNAYAREVTLHAHTAHPFVADGGILAYDTSPQFDYVLGDATNFWPLNEVREAYRQFVYVRPDVIVIYDRLLLGENPVSVKWPLMTLRNTANQGGNPQLEGDAFAAGNGTASLWGKALLPKGGKISSTVVNPSWHLSVGYVEIEPPAKTQTVEFLVAIRVGLAKPQPLECKLVDQAGSAGVSFDYEGKTYNVLFNREGDVGGHVRIEHGGKALVDRPLAREILDTYGNWKGTPMFDKWMTDERFTPYITQADRENFDHKGTKGTKN